GATCAAGPSSPCPALRYGGHPRLPEIVYRQAAGRFDSFIRRLERALELPRDPEPLQGERLLHALPERGSRTGVLALELDGQGGEPLASALGVLQRPGRPQASTKARAIALGQVLHDVSLLVADAALDRRPL